MIQAELHGKIPAEIRNSEDILTSNVFTFFKYSDRYFLKAYLASLGLQVSLEDAGSAEFLFWPSFEDGSEPDLVILCGSFYILFEAKLFSGFSSRIIDEKSHTVEEQLERESKNGEREARNLNKTFVLIAITSEYYKSKSKYKRIDSQQQNFIWTNWQFISSFLLAHLERSKESPDWLHLTDLYLLLEHKRLRSFRSIADIQLPKQIIIDGNIFYNPRSSSFKGAFTGFMNIPKMNLTFYNEIIFYDPSLKTR